jgi:hypothetical protein
MLVATALDIWFAMERGTAAFANGKQLLEVPPFGASTDTLTRSPNEMHGRMAGASPVAPAESVLIERDAPFALVAGLAAKPRTAIKTPTEQRTKAPMTRGLKRPDWELGFFCTGFFVCCRCVFDSRPATDRISGAKNNGAPQVVSVRRLQPAQITLSFFYFKGGYGSAVPDFDLTNEISALLRNPSVLTSSRKLALVTALPD